MQEKTSKILLIVPSLKQGGLQKVCVRTARLLQPHHDVSIAVFDGSEVFYDVSGLNVLNLNIPSRKNVFGKVINVLLRAKKLKKIKKELKIDMSYGFGPTANISNTRAKGCDKIVSGLRSYMDFQNAERLNAYAKKSDEVVCCSLEMLNKFQEVCPGKKARVLYNPYDINEIKALSKEKVPLFPWEKEECVDYKIIASMGREDDVKGFWHLIKAFSVVKKQEKYTRLIIIGEGDFSEYKNMAQELGIAEDIFFTGGKKNPYPYLAKADIYVLSSLFEGFPNALVEAMSLSIPVVATNCKTGPAEILLSEYDQLNLDTYMDADYGLLIPELSQEKNLDVKVIEKEEIIMAKAILSILKDEKKCVHYQKQSLLRAKHFSDDLYVERFKEILQG